MLTREPVLHPRLCSWFVLFAAMDVVLTWVILSSAMGGVELNPIAAHVLQAGGITAATYFKFATVMIVMMTSEYIGRRKPELGGGLLWLALCANCAVVIVSAVQITSGQSIGW